MPRTKIQVNLPPNPTPEQIAKYASHKKGNANIQWVNAAFRVKYPDRELDVRRAIDRVRVRRASVPLYGLEYVLELEREIDNHKQWRGAECLRQYPNSKV